MSWFYDLPLRRKLIVSFLPIAALSGVVALTLDNRGQQVAMKCLGLP